LPAEEPARNEIGPRPTVTISVCSTSTSAPPTVTSRVTLARLPMAVALRSRPAPVYWTCPEAAVELNSSTSEIPISEPPLTAVMFSR
jgi:hypothetical protein